MVARSSADALVLGEQIKAALHAGEHAKRQAIDLHKVQRVDVVLVPFDDLTVFHGGRLDRHEFVEPVMGEDEAARMLGEMTRRADQLAGEIESKTQTPVAQIEVQFLGVLRFNPFPRPAPNLRGQQFDEIFGQAERLADIAQRPLGAVADDRRAERGMIAAIGVEHPLQDDLAPLMLEIDIDVGRLAPLLRDETLEQKIVALGIDRGDAEHIADGAVGGRAAALTENVLAAGKTDDRVHRQEIGRIAELLDEAQLMGEDRHHFIGHAFGIARGGTFKGQLFERLLRREAGHGALFWILIGKLVEREAAARGDFDCACQGLGIAAKEPRHFFAAVSDSDRRGARAGNPRRRWCNCAGCR